MLLRIRKRREKRRGSRQRASAIISIHVPMRQGKLGTFHGGSLMGSRGRNCMAKFADFDPRGMLTFLRRKEVMVRMKKYNE